MTDAAQAIWGAVPGLLAGLLGLGLPHYVVGAVSGVLVLLAAFRGVRLRKARDAAIRGAELAEWR